MNIFKKLFGSSRNSASPTGHTQLKAVPQPTVTLPPIQTNAPPKPNVKEINPLVEKLISNYEPDFLDGLREAVGRADSGDYRAVEAMREAMRLRSGKGSVSFYSPGVMIAGMDRYLEAKPKILELARRQALLEDPEHSGDLIAALNTISDASTMSGVLHEIYRMGKKSEGFAFQLLFNEMRCSARFRV